MATMHPCSSCQRHLRAGEPSCPFCGARGACGAPLAARVAHPQPRGRVSRARWLAYGSAVAVIGCSSGSGGGGADSTRGKPDATTSNEGSAGQHEDSSNEGSAGQDEDSSTPTTPTDVADGNSADVALSPDGPVADVDAALSSDGPVADAGTAPPVRWEGDGSFFCGVSPPYLTAYCDKATQYCGLCLGSPCAWWTGGTLGGQCHTLDEEAGAVSVKQGACDGGPMRCACLTGCFDFLGYSYEFKSCQDDDGGGVTVSCNSCYGSPPARLERLVG